MLQINTYNNDDVNDLSLFTVCENWVFNVWRQNSISLNMQHIFLKLETGEIDLCELDYYILEWQLNICTLWLKKLLLHLSSMERLILYQIFWLSSWFLASGNTSSQIDWAVLGVRSNRWKIIQHLGAHILFWRNIFVQMAERSSCSLAQSRQHVCLRVCVHVCLSGCCWQDCYNKMMPDIKKQH